LLIVQAGKAETVSASQDEAKTEDTSQEEGKAEVVSQEEARTTESTPEIILQRGPSTATPRSVSEVDQMSSADWFTHLGTKENEP